VTGSKGNRGRLEVSWVRNGGDGQEGEREIALAVEEAAVSPLMNGDEALESLEKVRVAEECRGDGGGWNGRGMWKIDLENSDAPENQPWELT
jgi:hypothetical protein